LVFFLSDAGNRWRWIFIIEGAITCVFGIASRFIIIDFPDSPKNTFLTPEEKEFVKSRLSPDHHIEHEKVTKKVIFVTVMDWKVWSL